MIESTTPKLSEITPEETPELIAAREELAQAAEQRDQAEAVLEQRRTELNTQAAKVNALRQAVQAGDTEAAIVEPGEYREHQAMAQQVSDLQRAVTARRRAVRVAQSRLTVAMAVAGIGGIANDDEQARIAAELSHAVKLILRPVLQRIQESDRNIYATMERVKGHVREVPGLSMIGLSDRPSGFAYRDQVFNPHGETRLKGLFDRAWSNAQAELIQERKQAQEQAREQAQQG
ncbi:MULTISPECIES: hypothetical protein [Citricoccus]|uniref:hypothetical protein n=1 Tax=Citricoccus TaxID=169133 RepID=UPI000255E088|nr:hypothetical protein [Citricoccus sp. CH26A]